jgi:hypothetical protein
MTLQLLHSEFTYMRKNLIFFLTSVVLYEYYMIRPACPFLEFNYSIKWVDDGAYGSKNKETGEWNGLIGELLSEVGLMEGLSQVGLMEELLSQVGITKVHASVPGR